MKRLWQAFTKTKPGIRSPTLAPTRLHLRTWPGTMGAGKGANRLFERMLAVPVHLAMKIWSVIAKSLPPRRSSIGMIGARPTFLKAVPTFSLASARPRARKWPNVASLRRKLLRVPKKAFNWVIALTRLTAKARGLALTRSRLNGPPAREFISLSSLGKVTPKIAGPTATSPRPNARTWSGATDVAKKARRLFAKVFGWATALVRLVTRVKRPAVNIPVLSRLSSAKLVGEVTFVAVLLLFGALLLYIRVSPPFLAVASNSMEPVLSRGTLVMLTGVQPSEVGRGDIIVFDVPVSVQERYNYAPIVSHRITEVNESGGELSFRTKGDNTNADPFDVLPHQIRGQISREIPHLGYLVLFLQSKHGLFFVIACVAIYIIYANTDRLIGVGKRTRSVVFGVSAEELKAHTSEVREEVDGMRKALEQMAAAVSRYAVHLESHTSSVQGMSEAAQMLAERVAPLASVKQQLELQAQTTENLAETVRELREVIRTIAPETHAKRS